MKRSKTRWLLLAASCALIGLSMWLIGAPLVRFASEPEAFRAWVEQRGIVGAAAYVGIVALQVVLAFIPGEPFEIVAGYAFGAVRGTVLAVFAATLGSVAVFWLVRKFGRRLAELFFGEEKIRSLKFLTTTPRRKMLLWIFFLLPGTPKDLLCYYAGLTDLPFGEWLILCSFGRIPSVVTSTLGGDALGGRNYLLAAAVFGATLLISGAGLLLYRAIRQKKQA